MALVLASLDFLISIFFVPFMMFLLSILFLASVGKSLGVRRLYVKVLLMIFEYGKKDIEFAKNNKGNNEEEEDEAEIETKVTEYQNDSSENPLINNKKSVINGNGIKSNGLIKMPIANGGNSLISREDRHILLPEAVNVPISDETIKDQNDKGAEGFNNENKEQIVNFQLNTLLDYTKAGAEAIIEDQVTSRFEAEELKNWNLLIRTNRGYEFISWKLTFIWVCGFFVRYFFLFPVRVLICFCGVLWLTICTALVGYIPNNKFKSFVNKYVAIMCFGFLSHAISAVITYHNLENRPKKGGICVANHTSPIDVLVLMCDNCYSLIGQRHGGFLGILQRALARASPHIWFERSEGRDKKFVIERLKAHTSNTQNPPILIFPEGTCINNTSVMQFKKGSFDVESVIYPVAIKYDPRFGDAFWNSSRYSMIHYLYMMMTSWAIVCDVWYLPPMNKKEGESSIDFANRVKSAIAKQGGLVDLVWDGQLKRYNVKKEWKERQQEEFSKRLKVE